MHILRMAAIWFGIALVQPVTAEQIFVVVPVNVPDQKSVFATVESRRVVPARARIGGTVAELAIKEGDRVELGQVVATIGDEKLALQLKSLDAQIAGLEAQLAQAQSDLTRAEELFSRGTIPRTRLDEARTAFNVATNAMKARVAERSVLQQQLAEGAVLAPAAGRVLKVPLTTGTVILLGEPVAHIAEQDFVLRLRVPENVPRTEGSIDQTLLAHATARQADLIVMGGYGHSRLREFILGGATRGLLENTDRPVLFSD